MNLFASDDLEYEAHDLARNLDEFVQKHGDNPIMVAKPDSLMNRACSASAIEIEYDFVSSIYKSGRGDLFLACERHPFKHWAEQKPKPIGSSPRITTAQLSDLLKKGGQYNLTRVKGTAMNTENWRAISRIEFDDDKNLILS